MSTINGTNKDPNLVSQNRQNKEVNNDAETDDVIATGTVEDAELVTETSTLAEETVTLNTTNEIGDEVDIDDIDDGVDDVSLTANIAAEGYDADEDGALVFGLTNAIKGGADIGDTFKTELMSMAEEKYGASEMINEILDNDGNKIQVYKGESGEEFRIVEYAHNDQNDLNKSALIFADDSAIELQMLDNGIGGVGIHRVSGEKEDGSRDYTYVNSQVIQEGSVKTEQDENGNDIFVQNYDQINRADGSIIEDVSTTFHANGMVSTEYNDDEGIGHLLVGNSNNSASVHYTSEDNYTNAIDTSYAILGDDGFVTDWDDGTNVDTSDALYKDFDEKLDPFLEAMLAEINDPSAVGKVDGVDGTEEIEEETDDSDLSNDASSVQDLTLDTNGDGVVTDEELTSSTSINSETTNGTEDKSIGNEELVDKDTSETTDG